MRRIRFVPLVAIALALAVPIASMARSEETRPPDATKPAASSVPGARPVAASSVKAKPLSENVKKGIAFLAKSQQPDGGWGEGEEAAGMRSSGKMASVSNVADTSIATLSLFRSGNTPRSGEYAKQVLKGAEFVMSSIEKSDDDSLFVTDVRGTRVQGKIGVYVDTFLSSLLLAELRGTMPDAKSEARLDKALAKVIRKIEKNQQADGTYAGNAGWASVLSTGLASKSLNRASQAGVAVAPEALDRSQNLAVKSYDRGSGSFKSVSGAAGAPSDAGVPIYNTSAQMATISESTTTSIVKEEEAKKVLADAKAPKAEKDRARRDIARFEETRKLNDEAMAATVKRLTDDGFVSGFGSNGGEEFLSYMNISESLVQKGGKEWEKWDREISANLARVQNADGSWSGHHCITGRTFVTSSALLVLTADRLGATAASGSSAMLRIEDPKAGGKTDGTPKIDAKADDKVAKKTWYEKIWGE